MIALGNARCKCLMFRMKAVTKPAKTPAEITNSLNALTITPNFGQSLVTLAWDKAAVASRPGPVGLRIPQPPSPPGLIRPGQAKLSDAYGSIPYAFRVGAVLARIFYESGRGGSAQAGGGGAKHQAGLGGNAALHDRR